jgi:hypothetical protein
MKSGVLEAWKTMKRNARRNDRVGGKMGLLYRIVSSSRALAHALVAPAKGQSRGRRKSTEGQPMRHQALDQLFIHHGQKGPSSGSVNMGLIRTDIPILRCYAFLGPCTPPCQIQTRRQRDQPQMVHLLRIPTTQRRLLDLPWLIKHGPR